MSRYRVGQVARVDAELVDEGTGALVDADVTLEVIAPDGSRSFAALVSDGVGLRHGTVELSAPGRYALRWECTGARVAALETEIRVERTDF